MGIRFKAQRAAIRKKRRPATPAILAAKVVSGAYSIDIWTGINAVELSRPITYANGNGFSSGAEPGFLACKETGKIIVFGTANAVISNDGGITYQDCILHNFSSQSIAQATNRLVYEPGVGYFFCNGATGSAARYYFSGDGLTWTRFGTNLSGYHSLIVNGGNIVMTNGATTIAYTPMAAIRASWDADPTVLFNPVWSTTVTTGASLHTLIANTDKTLIKGLRYGSGSNSGVSCWETIDPAVAMTAASGSFSTNERAYTLRMIMWASQPNCALMGSISQVRVGFSRPGQAIRGPSISSIAQTPTAVGESVSLQRLFAMVQGTIRFATILAGTGNPWNAWTSYAANAGTYFAANGDFPLAA